MTEIKSGAAKALANLAEGEILATVEIAAPPERVFRALTSKEIVDWWVRPGAFDTREWTGDVRTGGRWRASGVARGQPYVLEGEFLEVQPPTKLVHTWQRPGMPGAPTTVTYHLQPIDGGPTAAAACARGGSRASSNSRGIYPQPQLPIGRAISAAPPLRRKRGRCPISRLLRGKIARLFARCSWTTAASSDHCNRSRTPMRS